MLVQKVLVPVDYSEPSREVLKFAGEVASRLGGSLLVLHVWECMPHAPADMKVKKDGKMRKLGDIIHENAEREMEQFLGTTALPKGLTVRHTVRSGDAAKCILSEREDEKCDLIVMGTHGRGGVSHLVLGSVAEKVVRGSPVPVMTVPVGSRED
jgi:nucleotide-binding universal stress UspA family protein